MVNVEDESLAPEVTFLDSQFSSSEFPWKTAEQYKCETGFPATEFYQVANFLLTNPNQLSSHLFRADILHDSTSELETPSQKEERYGTSAETSSSTPPTDDIVAEESTVPTSKIIRTVVRRLIPRKPQLDKAILQTCHFHEGGDAFDHDARLLVYVPHVSSSEDLPFYHPPIRAIAYFYQPDGQFIESVTKGTLSVHVLPFKSQDLSSLPSRYHRMFASTLSTFSKLAHSSHPKTNLVWRPQKDNILPQHIVQNTYTRLKETYAADLISKWVESTEPSKHVFEDLSIAAFLMELWRQTYGVVPLCERLEGKEDGEFPGFVDIACGNGVLVYILTQEGYKGWGFDARRRKTWSTFPENISLQETICIPKPFHDIQTDEPTFSVHDGIFPKGTFIISNHADELTPWTPIIAALSDPENPLPFLAIPCCSHALDGSKHRYKPKKSTAQSAGDTDETEQPKSGDLRAMRQAKIQHSQADPSASTYASLTAYVSDLAEEIGYQVEQTLMRIPSTRNIGLIGRKTKDQTVKGDSERILEIVQRESASRGGIVSAAKNWVTRSSSLQIGKGKGM